MSVVIIFLNPRPFLQDAIRSVYEQTHPHWELLLVDDGSTDGASSEAQTLAARDSERVRYLHHPGYCNKGMSTSRNLGLAHARGKYVTFLDADDALLPETLTEQVDLLDRHPEAAMVYGRIRYWRSWSGGKTEVQSDPLQPLGVRPGRIYPAPRLLIAWLQRWAAVPSGMLLRREIAQSVGGFEQAFRGLYEDQALCAKICLEWPVFVADKQWYLYRQHPKSACSIATARDFRQSRIQFLNWFASYLHVRNSTDQSVVRALQRERYIVQHAWLETALSFVRRSIRMLPLRFQERAL